MSKHLALISLSIFVLLSGIALNANAIKRFGAKDSGFHLNPVVKKEERKSLVENEFGRISTVDVGDGVRGPYHFNFITLNPNSLLLPQLLHADMVFFVHTGRGKISWAEQAKTETAELNRGDIFRLQAGSVFFVQSDLEPERESLRIYALFSDTDDNLFETAFGAYSSIRNLVRGFDKTTLKQAFKVPDEVIESITSAIATEDIVHAIPEKKDKDEKKKKKKDKDEKEKKRRNLWESDDRYLRVFPEGGEESVAALDNKKKAKGKGLNLFREDHDFENCNGWSLTASQKKADEVLGETDVGVFMVNLTKGSMMGPHWNPKATEIAIVLQGRGMVRVVCPSRLGAIPMWPECKNRRFSVKEGDIFAVPRFHPMAQMAFNDESFVFMGFTTTRQENRPQFLAGKSSVLQILDEDVLAASFNVQNTTITQLLAPQAESVILECVSCAEEEERKMVEDVEREKEEEAAREREKEEEERRRREEEEAREREKEEEERRRREEEEAREREKEEKRRRREEEEARRQEEEEARRREEEEARKREEEKARKREEEEARKREEEEARKREEEEEREREKEEKEEEEEREREKEEEIERERQRQEQVEEQERARQEAEERERERQKQEAEERERERQRQEQEEGQERARQEAEERERARQEEERQRQEAEKRERERKEEEGGEGWKPLLKTLLTAA